PPLLEALKAHHADAIAAGEATVVPGDLVQVDFSAGTIEARGEVYRFPALGSVPQSLVVAGGIENLVQRKLQSA
ncbi:MAG: hypothetical protein PVI01_14610, partial [Gemmatimonadales bacterium]